MLKETNTENIRLSPIVKSDAEDLLALRTNPAVATYLTRNLDLHLNDIERFINEQVSDPSNLYYKIESLSNLEFVGTIILKRINVQTRYAEVGYELLPLFEGKGYMTKALQKVMAIAFDKLGLKELEAFTHVDNAKSRRLLEKCGFQKTVKIDEKYSYNVVYRFDITDWVNVPGL